MVRPLSYGITARHVFQDFNWRQLAVTKERFGQADEPLADLDALYYPTALEGAAEGTDIGDIAVIKFSDNCRADFFNGTSYEIDAGTVVSSRSGDQLTIYGSLKSQSGTDEEGVVTAQYCTFTGLVDAGFLEGSPMLRQATITFDETITFDNITGISGGPVFNTTRNKLCGMVVRGGLNGRNGTIWYLDIGDIFRLVEGIHTRQGHVRYQRQAFR